MARSVTGLFTDQRYVDRIVGALIDAGFSAERICAVAPDEQAAGGATPADQTPTRGRGAGAWLVAHLLQQGLSHEYAQRYQEHVAQGRRLVSVSVSTDAEDEEARNLMVETGAEEISSAADGTLVPVQRSSAHWRDPPGLASVRRVRRHHRSEGRTMRRPLDRGAPDRAAHTGGGQRSGVAPLTGAGCALRHRGRPRRGRAWGARTAPARNAQDGARQAISL